MPSFHFTQAKVDSLRHESGKPKTVYADKRSAGLILEVRRSGGATYYLRYRDANQKARQYKIGARHALTLAQARQVANSLQYKIVSGIDPFQERRANVECPTLREFFLREYVPSIRRRNRSWKTEEAFIRLHVVPVIGHLPVNAITPQDVLRVFKVREKTAMASTLNRGISSIRSLFRHAVEWKVGGITKNPACDLKKYKEEERPVVCLAPEQAVSLFEAAERSPNRYLKHILMLLLQTGARKSELLNARWKDIDLEEGNWYVPRSKGGKPLCKPLNPAALHTLRCLPSRGRSPYLFPSDKHEGSPLTMFYRSWDSARKAAGLEGFRAHDLRHTFASTLVRQGHSLYEVKELLGHANITTTQRYAHLDPGQLRRTSATVAEVFGDIRV